MIAQPTSAQKHISHRATHTLGMAQLGLRGLAEEWWLRHLGDVHWQLIAASLGQTTTVFKDASGRQVYAAFCATEFAQLNPDHIGLGDVLEVNSILWAAGRSRLQSNHVLMVGNVIVARFRLISTFVCHEKDGLNSSICRTMPYLVPVLDPAPDAFAAQTSQTARACRAQDKTWEKNVLIHPCVGTDFNAVGLLYFPSFTRFFDQVERCLENSKEWAPVRCRRVHYFGNIERGEDVIGARTSSGKPVGLELWHSAGHAKPTKKLAHSALQRFPIRSKPA
ncbi:MAG: Pnap_2097 family protein [Pacificibacter sp.]|uniref:Pnap_2097 family protein n=1 Tax=Pacificibacter sp. TaxID=1917866 RepID=UPI00321A15D9